jgi:hypothetical protein
MPSSEFMRAIVGQLDNRGMLRMIAAAALLLAAACTPTFNWREVPVEATGLKATFPCKPDKADHSTQFAPGRPIVLHAVGCQAGGASFVVLYGDIGAAGDLAAALVQWKKASQATIHSTGVSEQPWHPAGALDLAPSSMTRSDAGALQSQSGYFARGTSLFQVAVYAPKLKPEMTEPFFAGLRFE